MSPSPRSHTPPATVELGWQTPLRWLALGWRDIWRHPGISLAHGAAMAAFGLLLMAVAHDRFWFLVGAFSGFLIVAPILAAGLYLISRRAQQGLSSRWADVWALWRSGDRRLVGFGLLLGLAGTGWVLTSAGLITLWAPQPVRQPLDFVRVVVLAPPGDLLFEAWMLVGALLAAPVYASSVLTMPLLMDRPLPLWAAVAQSWRGVANHPVASAAWAVCIVLLVGAGMATAMLGLVLVLPWLGHASWHAYGDLGAGA